MDLFLGSVLIPLIYLPVLFFFFWCHTVLICCCWCCSVAKSCLTLWDPMDGAISGLPVLHHLPDFAQVHVHWVGDAIQPSYPLLQSSRSAFSHSQHQQFFPNEFTLHIRWPKYWSFSFSISPSNEYSGLVSFKTEWFDLLAVQETLKSLFQHHSSKASILWHCLDYYGGGSLVAQSCLTLSTPWTVACHALLSKGFSRQRILEWVAISFSTCLLQVYSKSWSQVASIFQVCSSPSILYCLFWVFCLHINLRIDLSSFEFSKVHGT